MYLCVSPMLLFVVLVLQSRDVGASMHTVWILLSYLVIVGYPEYRIPRSWQPPWPTAFGLHLPFY